MAIFYKYCFALLVIQISVNAAPNADEKSTPSVASLIEKTPNNDNTEPKLDSEPYGISADNDKIATESNNNQRQKRMFNYYLPPLNSLFNYPSYERQNNPYDQSIYGTEDPYLQIYKRVQDIANAVRQPPPPPPPVYSQYPIFLPVIYYIPQVGCGCQPNANGSIPGIDNRAPPQMDDERQNWGLLVNQTYPTEEGDGSRPISLVPIPPSRPLPSRPPPVEHGSSQAGASGTTTTQATTTEKPTACDGAVISCCHQQEITYDCFVQRGCQTPALVNNNPCNSNVILDVIQKFSMFYGRRTG